MARGSGDRGGNDTVFVAGMGDIRKPLNLLMAIEEIQHMSAMEVDMEEPLNKNFFALKQRFDFIAVGFKHGILNGLITALLTPLAFGVVDRLIPVFGERQLSTFDELYAFALAIAFPLGFAIFLSSLRSCYVGTISKAMIRNLFGGLFAGVLFKALIIFFAFNWLYIAMTPEHVYSFLMQVHKILPRANLVPVYYWLLKFRYVLPESVVFVVLTSLLVVILPTITLVITSLKQRKKGEREVEEID